MQFCEQCGTQLEEGTVFCPECGAPVAAVGGSPRAACGSRRGAHSGGVCFPAPGDTRCGPHAAARQTVSACLARIISAAGGTRALSAGKPPAIRGSKSGGVSFRGAK
ncbi:hypothetical protein FACS1894171_1140 [Clostridia bacterium]|nr:hypothetical protein FACS1894171_1140 [Clostridia bacterium]